MPVSDQNKVLQAVFELYDDYTVAMKKIIESQKEFEDRQKRADQAAGNFQVTLWKTGGKANKGKINKWAAMLLLSRAYLYMEK